MDPVRRRGWPHDQRRVVPVGCCAVQATYRACAYARAGTHPAVKVIKGGLARVRKLFVKTRERLLELKASDPASYKAAVAKLRPGLRMFVETGKLPDFSVTARQRLPAALPLRSGGAAPGRALLASGQPAAAAPHGAPRILSGDPVGAQLLSADALQAFLQRTANRATQRLAAAAQCRIGEPSKARAATA